MGEVHGQAGAAPWSGSRHAVNAKASGKGREACRCSARDGREYPILSQHYVGPPCERSVAITWPLVMQWHPTASRYFRGCGESHLAQQFLTQQRRMLWLGHLLCRRRSEEQPICHENCASSWFDDQIGAYEADSCKIMLLRLGIQLYFSFKLHESEVSCGAGRREGPPQGSGPHGGPLRQ